MSRKTPKDHKPINDSRINRIYKAFVKPKYTSDATPTITLPGIDQSLPQGRGFLAETVPPTMPVAPPVVTPAVTAAPVATSVEASSTTTTKQPIRRTAGVPVLKITPYAWRKLRYMRGKTNNEVGFFAITEKDDPLLITDVAVLHQQVGMASVEFDGVDVARFWAECDAAGLLPAQYTRIWVHTHPGNSATPSGTDHNTFNLHWGQSDWAIMMVVAQDDSYTIKLRYNVGIPADFSLQLQITYDLDFPATNKEVWDKEYAEKVKTFVSRPVNTQYQTTYGQYPYYDGNWKHRHEHDYDEYQGHLYAYDRGWTQKETRTAQADTGLFQSGRLYLSDIWDKLAATDRMTIARAIGKDILEPRKYFVYTDGRGRSTNDVIGIYEVSERAPHISKYKTCSTLPSLAKYIKEMQNAPVTTTPEETQAADVYLNPDRSEIETPKSEEIDITAEMFPNLRFGD